MIIQAKEQNMQPIVWFVVYGSNPKRDTHILIPSLNGTHDLHVVPILRNCTHTGLIHRKNDNTSEMHGKMPDEG